jgi:hypothetical protein
MILIVLVPCSAMAQTPISVQQTPSNYSYTPFNPSSVIAPPASQAAQASSSSTVPSGIYNPNAAGSTNAVTGIYTPPVVTSASTTVFNGTCSTSIKKFGDIFLLGACIINKFLLTSAVTLGVIYFSWGVVQYVLSADSAEERKKSKQVMLWGVLSLFVIVSVWGIIGAFRVLLGI